MFHNFLVSHLPRILLISALDCLEPVAKNATISTANETKLSECSSEHASPWSAISLISHLISLSSNDDGPTPGW